MPRDEPKRIKKIVVFCFDKNYIKEYMYSRSLTLTLTPVYIIF